MKNSEDKYFYGQKMYERKSERCAYIITEDPETDYLIKMIRFFPRKAGDKPFFVHIEKLKRLWRKETEGVQMLIKY